VVVSFMVADIATPVDRQEPLVARTLDVLPGVIHLLAQASAEAYGEEPLTLTQVRLLRCLEAGSRLTSELASRLGVSASTVSAAVDGLVRRGLIERVPSSEDRRTMPLRVTEAGEGAVAAARQRQERALAGLVAALTPGERRALGRGIAALGRALEAGG
jgi:DNA-binding MarR family transcriptional regulator